MTALQFAKAQCANYQTDGTCLGIWIKDDGTVCSFGRRDYCVLIQSGVRCRYFEECVAPMGIEDARLREERNEAVRAYRKQSNAPKFAHQTGRICPKCKVRELEPRRRFCYVCAQSNKRQANRVRTT